MVKDSERSSVVGGGGAEEEGRHSKEKEQKLHGKVTLSKLQNTSMTSFHQA